MAIQLGSSNISNIYIGNINVEKVFLGNSLVYSKTVSQYVTDGLCAYYDLTQFDIGNTVIQDLSGNNKTMTVGHIGAMCTKDSKGGLAANDNVNIYTNDMGLTTTTATLEWYSTPNNISNAWENRTCGISGDNGDGFFLWVASSGSDIRVCPVKNGTGLGDEVITCSLPSNEPSHFVITFGETEYNIYINKNLITSGTCNANAGNNCIYRLANASAGTNVNHTLYSARIYNRVLTPEEININYQFEYNKFLNS